VYRGGKTHLEKSNQVIDSDLEIAAGVPHNSAGVKQLLRDFSWRTVTYDAHLAPGMVKK
jgi:hypothetical protein